MKLVYIIGGKRKIEEFDDKDEDVAYERANELAEVAEFVLLTDNHENTIYEFCGEGE